MSKPRPAAGAANERGKDVVDGARILLFLMPVLLLDCER
jgi:hypothetical protein